MVFKLYSRWVCEHNEECGRKGAQQRCRVWVCDAENYRKFTASQHQSDRANKQWRITNKLSPPIIRLSCWGIPLFYYTSCALSFSFFTFIQQLVSRTFSVHTSRAFRHVFGRKIQNHLIVSTFISLSLSIFRFISICLFCFRIQIRVLTRCFNNAPKSHKRICSVNIYVHTPPGASSKAIILHRGINTAQYANGRHTIETPINAFVCVGAVAIRAPSSCLSFLFRSQTSKFKLIVFSQRI